jgi:DNA-binding transcriptional ArsR family regulator
MAKSSPTAEPDLMGALAHPIRLAIMRAAVDQFSPKQMADSFGDVSLQLVSYHVRILRDAGLLKLTGTEPRRGALEHFYRASPDAASRLASLGRTLTSLSDDLGSRPSPKGGTRKKAASKR